MSSQLLQLVSSIDIRRKRRKIQSIIIEPPTKGIVPNLLGIWQFRHLLVYLSIQAMNHRYRETILGWMWLILRPLIPVILFTVILGEVINVDFELGEVPYFLFLLTGMSLWNFLSTALKYITKSLKTHKKLLKINLSFPRILVPIASISPAIVELITYLVLLLIANLFYFLAIGQAYIILKPELALSFLFILLTVFLVLGIGFWTSVLNNKVQDIRFTIPFIVQGWFYVTPVLYPVSLVPSDWRWVIYLNPMATIIEGFKWSVLGLGKLNVLNLAASSVVIFFILLSGLWFFSKAELYYTDINDLVEDTEIDDD